MASSVIDILHSLGLTEDSELWELLYKLEDYNLVTTEELRNIQNISVKPLPNIVRNQADALKQRMYGVATDEDYGLPLVINRRMVLVRYILENFKSEIDNLNENLSSWIDTIVYETETGGVISRCAQKDAKNNIIDETYETKEDANQKQQTVAQTINSTKEELKQYTNNQTNALEQSTQTKLNSKADKKEIPTKVSQLTNDNDFIDNTVNNLINYYKKSETYTQEEINNLVSSIPKFDIQVVSSLPTSNISSTTVYLISGGEDTNLYTEWIYVNNKWELLGSQKVDLTDYALKTDVLNIIDNNSQEVEELTFGNSSSVNWEDDTQVPSSKSVKGYVDSVLGDVESILGGI